MSRSWGLGHQLRKMLLPNPADQPGRIILVFGEPELAPLADDIEDLKRDRTSHQPFKSQEQGRMQISTGHREMD